MKTTEPDISTIATEHLAGFKAGWHAGQRKLVEEHMSQPALATRIEDVGPGSFNDDREIFLCSAAISLKRIADGIWGDKDKHGEVSSLIFSLGEMIDVIRHHR